MKVKIFASISCLFFIVGFLFISCEETPNSPKNNQFLHNNDIRCGTYKPSLKETNALELQTQQWLSQKGNTVPNVIKTIPVAFHVVRGNNGEWNVSDHQLRNQLDVLNRSFSNTNWKFSLYSIDRTNNTLWSTDKDHEYGMKQALAIDPAHVLNFYTGNIGNNLLGYARFPWESPEDNDAHGVVCLYSSLPGGSTVNYNEGDTGVHEVGHYLGLYHTFQGGCNPPGDHVDDTNPEASKTSGCPIGKTSCGSPDPIHNFMDYSYDRCLDHFTSGQSVRMDEQMAKNRPSMGSPVGNWERIPGLANDIGVGSDGEVWVAGVDNRPYRWNGTGWDKKPGMIAKVSVGNKNEIWVINKSNKTYKWNGTGWDKKSGLTNDIGVGSDGEVWVAGVDNRPYRWNGTRWNKKPGMIAKVSVGNKNEIWVVNLNGEIYKWNGTGWDKKPGSANDVGVGSDGRAWVVSGGGAYIWFGLKKKIWMRMATQRSSHIDVGSSNHVWRVDTKKRIWRKK